MPRGVWRALSCPNGCPEGRQVATLLPNGVVFVCFCRACQTIWIESPAGRAAFTASELQQLWDMRDRYLRDELPR